MRIQYLPEMWRPDCGWSRSRTGGLRLTETQTRSGPCGLLDGQYGPCRFGNWPCATLMRFVRKAWYHRSGRPARIPNCALTLLDPLDPNPNLDFWVWERVGLRMKSTSDHANEHCRINDPVVAWEWHHGGILGFWDVGNMRIRSRYIRWRYPQPILQHTVPFSQLSCRVPDIQEWRWSSQRNPGQRTDQKPDSVAPNFGWDWTPDSQSPWLPTPFCLPSSVSAFWPMPPKADRANNVSTSPLVPWLLCCPSRPCIRNPPFSLPEARQVRRYLKDATYLSTPNLDYGVPNHITVSGSPDCCQHLSSPLFKRGADGLGGMTWRQQPRLGSNTRFSLTNNSQRRQP
ncbi:hypothetical protein B0T20DRAFT_63416 [Sordaria brevicollis]|uniref:Uncharacterized protein n=1 Tax=Sordaria brevicollis TaxID=83679 RepID=A0AAE0P1N9_SORBR|nr:hypothetical protein B0T20DRAFT_63416 [Sordaria brevicollis]